MKIEVYGYARIVVDGKLYETDVIIFPDRIKEGWCREFSHRLDKEDIEEIIQEKPEILIIGTGRWKQMSVPKETQEYIESHGIELIFEETMKAVELFNELSDKKKVVAALHLTC